MNKCTDANFYTYEEVNKELLETKYSDNNNLHFNDTKNIYHASLCSYDTVRWCKQDGGHYKDEGSYSDQAQEYMKNAKFKRIIGWHPFI